MSEFPKNSDGINGFGGRNHGKDTDTTRPFQTAHTERCKDVEGRNGGRRSGQQVFPGPGGGPDERPGRPPRRVPGSRKQQATHDGNLREVAQSSRPVASYAGKSAPGFLCGHGTLFVTGCFDGSLRPSGDRRPRAEDAEMGRGENDRERSESGDSEN